MGLSLWLVAGIIWRWIPHPELPPPPAQQIKPQAAADSPRANVNQLINQQLFGKAVAAPTAKPAPDTSNAPETRLNLKLAGVILSENPDLSRALIADNNGKQKSYAVGDPIEGASASIHEIYADHVVLERNGRYETLRLQKQTASSRTASVSSSSQTSSRGTTGEGVANELKSVREQILKDPSKAGDFIRVRPVYSKGALTGYRIYPGKDRALFRKVGLRSGDLVQSINGQQLNDPQQAFSMLSTLSSASSITLELQRRGRTETVSVDLGSE
jgi:general secretion pathway protein C